MWRRFRRHLRDIFKWWACTLTMFLAWQQGVRITDRETFHMMNRESFSRFIACKKLQSSSSFLCVRARAYLCWSVHVETNPTSIERLQCLYRCNPKKCILINLKQAYWGSTMKRGILGIEKREIKFRTISAHIDPHHYVPASMRVKLRSRKGSRLSLTLWENLAHTCFLIICIPRLGMGNDNWADSW